MRDLKCIIFDCDGVLVDSEAISNQVLLDMAKDHGFKMSLQHAMSQFNGVKFQKCLDFIEQHTGITLPSDFEQNFRKKTFEAFGKDLKPVPGAKEFIESLKIEYCVASSGPVEKIRRNLTTTGLIDKFENKIFSAYEINSWKPDPDLFLFAAKQMGFPVENCVVIEDSTAGIIAAVRGGFTVYGFAHDGNAKELEEQGAIVFYSFEELSNRLFSGK